MGGFISLLGFLMLCGGAAAGFGGLDVGLGLGPEGTFYLLGMFGIVFVALGVAVLIFEACR